MQATGSSPAVPSTGSGNHISTSRRVADALKGVRKCNSYQTYEDLSTIHPGCPGTQQKLKQLMKVVARGAHSRDSNCMCQKMCETNMSDIVP